MLSRHTPHPFSPHRFSNSDTLLAHFLSFSATPTYYTLPQTLQDGMPLFYLQPNQSKPVSLTSLTGSVTDITILLFCLLGTLSRALNLWR